jgi:hypothetical protein
MEKVFQLLGFGQRRNQNFIFGGTKIQIFKNFLRSEFLSKTEFF